MLSLILEYVADHYLSVDQLFTCPKSTIYKLQMDHKITVMASPEIGSTALVECIDINKVGNGISRWNDWIIETPFLIPEEIALVEIIYKKNSEIKFQC